MSVTKMFKLSRMSYPATCSNLRLNTTRNCTTKANHIKQWRKEERKVFGPLLETSREKAQRMQLMTELIPPSQTNLTDKKNENVDNDSERLWALGVSPHRLRIIKQESKSGATEISQSLSRSNKIVTIGEDPHSVIEKIASSTNGTNKMTDITGSIKHVPMINTPKSDVDKWESLKILSLSPSDQKHYSLPGVTRVLNESMSDKAKLLLENWKKRMILELGEEGFATYQRDLLQNSKIMHSLIESTLKKEPIDVPDHLQLTYKSISSVLEDIKDVRFIESHVVHPTLGYRGFIDCVATYKGNLCVIDWKKSDKLKTLGTMYDSPLQISAYIGALNSDENYSFKVKTGLLAIAYAHGQPPSVFELSGARLEFYWKEWLKRLEKYYAMRYS